MNKDLTQTCSGVIFFYLLRGRKTKGSMVSNIMRTIMKKIDEKKTIPFWPPNQKETWN